MSINDDAIKKLSQALEADMYAPNTDNKVRYDLKRLLGKLGIKSANGSLWGEIILQMESLEATLQQVKFDTEKFKRWKK